MENSTGLSSIRKKNKDVFGRSNRRFPVFIVGAILVVALFVVSFVLGRRQNEELQTLENQVQIINRQITALQLQQGNLSEEEIDLGTIMQRLPTSNTVDAEKVLIELRDYVAMAEIDTTTASITVNPSSTMPEAISNLSSTVGAYQCLLQITADELSSVTDLLNRIYEGGTFYYVDYLSIQTSGLAASASITLYTFFVNE